MAPSSALAAAPGAVAASEQDAGDAMEGCEVAPQPALALPAGRPPSALPHSGSADPLAPCTPAASDAGAGYGDAGVLARAGSAAGQRCAYVTLLTRDAYLPGVQALARSLVAVQAWHPLLILCTPDSLSPAALAALEGEPGCQLLPVQRYVPPGRHDPSQYKLACYWECWTKLRLWEQGRYDRLVYLDADMIVLRNIDALFALPPGFYAVPDCSAGRATQAERDACPLFRPHAPHYFNAGMFVVTPCRQQLAALEALLLAGSAGGGSSGAACCVAVGSTSSSGGSGGGSGGSGGGGGGIVGGYAEQDLLNAFFLGAWRPLPHTFNAQKGIRRHHPQLWEAHWGQAAVLHMTDAKPWQADHPDHKQDADLVALWWAAYEGRLRPLGPPAAPQLLGA